MYNIWQIYGITLFTLKRLVLCIKIVNIILYAWIPYSYRDNISFDAKKELVQKKRQEQDLKLPFWVEFLFVQIGLPDFILRKFLKTKRRAKQIIKNNTKDILYFAVFFIFLLYINPLIRKSNSFNSCVTTAMNLITTPRTSTKPINANLRLIRAHNACHGGQIDLWFASTNNQNMLR